MSVYFYFYQDELLYIGSTFDMKERIKSHKKDYRRSKLPFYRELQENGLTMDDLELEEVKTGIIDDIELTLEGKCQRLYKPQCNKRIEGRTIKEYLEDKKDFVNKQAQVYRSNNKEVISTRGKTYYENNKIKILKRHKNNRDNEPKEIVNERARRYRATHLNQLKKYQKLKAREYRAKKKLAKSETIQEE